MPSDDPDIDIINARKLKELREKVKAGKSSSEIEKELNSQDVAYKIKNDTSKQ